MDCETPIIGDQLRCPACQADHAAAAPLGGAVLAWMVIVAVELVAVVVCAVLLVLKGCSA